MTGNTAQLYKNYSGYLNDPRFLFQKTQAAVCATIDPALKCMHLSHNLNFSEIKNYMAGSKPTAQNYVIKFLLTYNGIDSPTYEIGESLIYEYDQYTQNPTYVFAPQSLVSMNSPNFVGLDADLGRTVVKVTHVLGGAGLNDEMNYTVRYNAPLLYRDLYINQEDTCVYVDGWYSHYAIAVTNYSTNTVYTKGSIMALNIAAWDSAKTYLANEIVTHNGYFYKSKIGNLTTEPEENSNSQWLKGNAASYFFLKNTDVSKNSTVDQITMSASEWTTEIPFKEWYLWMRRLEYVFKEADKNKLTQGRYLQTQFVVYEELSGAVKKETQKICDYCKDVMFYEYSRIEPYLKLRQKRDSLEFFFEDCNFRVIQELLESTRAACKSCNALICFN
jgi:hypothetical protein